MDIRELKKHLARLGIAGLLAGAGLALTASGGCSRSGWAGKEGGTGGTTKETATQSAPTETAAAPKAAPSGGWSGSK